MKYKYNYTSSYSDMETKGRVYLGKKELDIYDAVNLLNSKNERIAELENVLKLVHEDLLMRSEKDCNGYSVVDLSSWIWTLLKETLKIVKSEGK